MNTNMDEEATLTFYQLCCDGNLDEIIATFGNTVDTSNIEMSYVYYNVYWKTHQKNKESLKEWLIKLDSEIDVDMIKHDYNADEITCNDAFWLACENGYFKLVKWLFTKEPFLTSFKNRCVLCNAFELSCGIDIYVAKIIFNQLSDYIRTRITILNQAYYNASANKKEKIMDWLLETNPNITLLLEV